MTYCAYRHAKFPGGNKVWISVGKMAITFSGAMQRASLRCVPGVERAMIVGTPPKLLEMARWNG